MTSSGPSNVGAAMSRRRCRETRPPPCTTPPSAPGGDLAQPPRQRPTGGPAHGLTEDEAEGLRVVAKPSAGRPPWLGLRQHVTHVLPVAQVCHRRVVRRRRHTRRMQQHVARCHTGAQPRRRCAPSHRSRPVRAPGRQSRSYVTALLVAGFHSGQREVWPPCPRLLRIRAANRVPVSVVPGPPGSILARGRSVRGLRRGPLRRTSRRSRGGGRGGRGGGR